MNAEQNNFAVIEETIHLPFAETQMETYTAHPAGEGRWPGVLMYMDAQGLRGELYRIAREIAAWGFVVSVFDLYHRFGRFRPNLTTADDQIKMAVRAMVVTALNHVDYRYVMEDTRAVLDHWAEQPYVSPGPVGSLGFCFSGRFAVIAAARFPERVKAAAALFGTELVTERPDSPHLQAKTVQGKLYFGFAENDRYVDSKTINRLAATLAEAHVAYDISVIQGAEHGFCFRDGGHVYNPAASEQAWNKIHALLANLGNE